MSRTSCMRRLRGGKDAAILSAIAKARQCLREIGGFDEAAFGKGYGEETDFCQRAIQHGWRNVLAADVFVFHVGEVSFSKSGGARRAKAAAVMEAPTGTAVEPAAPSPRIDRGGEREGEDSYERET